MEFRANKLGKDELFWRDRHDWLFEHGYVLRPRYRPGWEPSWKGTNGFPLRFEDGWQILVSCFYDAPDKLVTDLPQPGSNVLDAVRQSDGEMVMLKQVSRSIHPNEISIGQYLSSPDLALDPRNHSCPVLDVLQDPLDPDMQLLVMPLLKEFNEPPHITVGEAIDFFRQAFEV